MHCIMSQAAWLVPSEHLVLPRHQRQMLTLPSTGQHLKEAIALELLSNYAGLVHACYVKFGNRVKTMEESGNGSVADSNTVPVQRSCWV